MDSTLRKLLATDDLRERLDRLNNDLVIGPSANGDGDLIQWYLAVCDLGVMHLTAVTGELPTHGIKLDAEVVSTKARELKPMEFFSWATDHLFAELCFSKGSPKLKAELSKLAEKITREISLRWGGRRVRLHVRRKVGGTKSKIESALRSGTPIKEISEKTGISRATVYRVLKQKH